MKLLNEIQQKLVAKKNQYNSFGKYHYRSCEDILEAVKPLLGDGGLIVGDRLQECAGRAFIVATATLYSDDSDENGTSVQGCAEIPTTQKGMSASQITGCASSYARKYALNGLFCIDDSKDADTDAYNKPQPKPKPKPKPAKLPAMDESEIAAMTSVFLIAVANKPDKQDLKAFKAEAANKLYKSMGHWPITQQEQEEAIAILDKEYKK